MSLQVIAVVRSEATKGAIAKSFPAVNGTRCEILEGPLAALRTRIGNSHAPDVLLVEVDPESKTETETLASYVDEHRATTAVVATSMSATVDGVRRLMRTGISDFLPQPFSASELATALEVALGRLQKAVAARAPRGRAFAFMKSCGGAGATTLAVQTAHALVSRRTRLVAKPEGQKGKGNKVCLLDLDLQCGNAAIYLDLNCKFSVVDLVGPLDRLDASLLHGVMTQHESGLHVLAAPQELVPLDAVPSEIVIRLVEIARHSYDFVVLSLPQVWMPWTSPTLLDSDAVVLVTQIGVAPLRQARRRINTFIQEGLGRVPLVTVANRFTKPGFLGSGVRVAEAEKCLGRRIDYFIRSDFKAVEGALNHGQPIAQMRSGSRVEKDIEVFIKALLTRFAGEQQRNEPVLAAPAPS